MFEVSVPRVGVYEARSTKCVRQCCHIEGFAFLRIHSDQRLRQGASPLDLCDSNTSFKMEWRPCISVRKGDRGPPIFDDSQKEMNHSREFRIGGSMVSLVEMV